MHNIIQRKMTQKKDQLVATHISGGKKIKVTDTDTTNGNSPKKINWLIPEIISIFIPLTPRIVYGVAASRGNLYARQTISLWEIVMNATRSGSCVFKDLTVVIWEDTDGTIP